MRGKSSCTQQPTVLIGELMVSSTAEDQNTKLCQIMYSDKKPVVGMEYGIWDLREISGNLQWQRKIPLGFWSPYSITCTYDSIFLSLLTKPWTDLSKFKSKGSNCYLSVLRQPSISKKGKIFLEILSTMARIWHHRGACWHEGILFQNEFTGDYPQKGDFPITLNSCHNICSAMVIMAVDYAKLTIATANLLNFFSNLHTIIVK